MKSFVNMAILVEQKFLKLYNENKFPNQLMVPAHLIHGSSDDRFSITYAVNPKLISKTEIESVGFNYMNIDDAIKRYNPDKLSDGWQIMPDGEEIYFIKKSCYWTLAFTLNINKTKEK